MHLQIHTCSKVILGCLLSLKNVSESEDDRLRVVESAQRPHKFQWCDEEMEIPKRPMRTYHSTIARLPVIPKLGLCLSAHECLLRSSVSDIVRKQQRIGSVVQCLRCGPFGRNLSRNDAIQSTYPTLHTAHTLLNAAAFDFSWLPAGENHVRGKLWTE